MSLFRIEERSVLQSIVDGALACKTFLTDILKFAFYYMDKDLNVISSKLTTALKVRLNIYLLYSLFFFILLCCGFTISFHLTYNRFLMLELALISSRANEV